MNVKSQCMHSNHSQQKREQTLRMFRKGAIKVLVVSRIHKISLFYFTLNYFFI